MSGARIRALLVGERRAGPHEVAWDGRDDRGRRVAAGAYFLRLRAGEASVTRKVLRIR